MTDRISVTLSDDTGKYLRKAAGGNVSAYVERLVRYQQVRDSAATYARWFANRPGYAEDAATETESAHAELERGVA